MPVAFLVFGPESSGTRLLTRMLIKMGCFGDAGNWQRLDRTSFHPPDDLNIVFRRSLPHAGQYPDLQAIYNRFVQDYTVKCVITQRSLLPMARSQVLRGHKPDIETAIRSISHANYLIWRFIDIFAPPYFMLTLEDLILHREDVLSALQDFAGLQFIEDPEPITDVNSRHYGR